MMKRTIKFLFALLVAFTFTFNSYAEESNPEEDKLLLTVLNYVLTKFHYEPHQLDDAFSKSVFDDFMESLDPSKRYFLQSDIDEFKAYRTKIDDQIKNKDLSFFNLVHKRFMQRSQEAKSYYKTILTQPFNMDKDETLDIDYENAPYAKSKTELINLWQRQLKFGTLTRLHDRLEHEKDQLKLDANYKVKSFETLEKEARQTTLENMDEFFMRFEELTSTDWFSTFVNCIAEEFDPHTSYYDPSVKKRFDIQMAGKLEGIGARLTKDNEYTKVSELISGGPAWKQGELEAGDLILKVGQGAKEPKDIVGMRLDDAIEYIKGKKGTEVRLTIKKVDGEIKVIKLIRDVVQLEEVFVKSSTVEKDGRKFGVIHLPKFYADFNDKNFRNCASDMALEIERLKKENIEGLIIDLRNNGGGSLQAVVEMSGLFIDKGPIVQVKFRGEEAQIRKDKNPAVQWTGPLVVMVNEQSASASEIFAAAMQDYKRAVIIGAKQTFGKGTVQQVVDLNRWHTGKIDIGALKMTIQKFYRVNGGSTQLEGVHSDIKLPSRYTYMNIGERELSKALKFDKVPAANYSLWNNYENFNEVISNSKNRIQGNATFKLIDNYAKWLKKSQDDTLIYLNYEAYKNDLDDHKEASKQFKGIRDYTTNLTYKSPLYELPLLKQNEDLANKREAWHKNLKKDIYLEEALNVVSDLKIKPSYELVKN